MNPITLATLHSFCRVCLRELFKTSYKPNHDVENENITELLQNIACISTDDTYKYPQKICHSCYIKMIALDSFRQKYIFRIGVLKLTIMEDLNEPELHRLKKLCRVCLRHANDNIQMEENPELLGILDICSGLKSNAVEDADLLLADDNRFPRTLCNKCLSKLKTFMAFRTLAQQSDEYFKSLVLDGESAIEMKNEAIEVKNEAISLEKMERGKECFSSNFNGETSMGNKQEYPHQYIDSSLSNNDKKTQIKIEFFESEYETLNDIDEPLIPNSEILKIEQNPLDDISQKEEDTASKTPELIKNHQPVEIFSEINSHVDCTSEENNSIKIKEKNKKKTKTKRLILKEGELQTRRSKKYIYCSKCDKQFYKQLMLEAHIKSVHEGIERPFVCNFPNCFSTFRKKSGLDRHRILMHTPKEPTPTEVDIFALPKPNVHICMTCLRQFKRRDVLDQHINTAHTKTELRPFKCQFCQKGFGSKRTMLRHEKNHSNERPFICEFCPKRYNTKVELTSHKQRHITKPELLCPICKRGKSNAEELQKHIAMHEASRQHQCPICGRVFTKLFHLREHESAVHLKLRPYKCSHCSKTFATRRTQKEHEELHDPTMRPVFCALCTMHFKNEGSLSRHMTKEHDQPSKKIRKKNEKKAQN